MKEYVVRAAAERPAIGCGWNARAWTHVAPLPVGEFRPESSDHRPRTRARLVYSPDGLHGVFRVEDRYVLCRHGSFQAPVWEDSCVEIFLQPKPERGYFNFEMSCGGALLASHVTDHRRTAGGLAASAGLTREQGERIAVRSTLAAPIVPEIEAPLDWELSFFIPFAVLEAYVGPIGAVTGQRWRANLFKCGDRTSHPHWASWSPVDSLNFHLPHCFGVLQFEDGG